MNRLKNMNGMSLLEVAIALFLLAIGLLGLAGLQLVSLRGDTLGHQATLATTLAKDKLAELQKAEQFTDGADQYIDTANGMTYDRQWSVNHDVPEPEMAIVRVQVSWRGEMADRAVIVSAVAPLAKPPEVALWPEGTLTKGSPPVWSEPRPES